MAAIGDGFVCSLRFEDVANPEVQHVKVTVHFAASSADAFRFVRFGLHCLRAITDVILHLIKGRSNLLDLSLQLVEV